MFLPLPKIAARLVGTKVGSVNLHPTLSQALQQRAGAADEFRAWLSGLCSSWQIDNLCAAHSGALLANDNTGKSVNERLRMTLTRAEGTLAKHDRNYGKSTAANATVPAAAPAVPAEH